VGVTNVRWGRANESRLSPSDPARFNAFNRVSVLSPSTEMRAWPHFVPDYETSNLKHSSPPSAGIRGVFQAPPFLEQTRPGVLSAAIRSGGRLWNPDDRKNGSERYDLRFTSAHCSVVKSPPRHRQERPFAFWIMVGVSRLPTVMPPLEFVKHNDLRIFRAASSLSQTITWQRPFLYLRTIPSFQTFTRSAVGTSV
jgi:hypothetical protein